MLAHVSRLQRRRGEHWALWQQTGSGDDGWETTDMSDSCCQEENPVVSAFNQNLITVDESSTYDNSRRCSSSSSSGSWWGNDEWSQYYFLHTVVDTRPEGSIVQSDTSHVQCCNSLYILKFFADQFSRPGSACLSVSACPGNSFRAKGPLISQASYLTW